MEAAALAASVEDSPAAGLAASAAALQEAASAAVCHSAAPVRSRLPRPGVEECGLAAASLLLELAALPLGAADGLGPDGAGAAAGAGATAGGAGAGPLALASAWDSVMRPGARPGGGAATIMAIIAGARPGRLMAGNGSMSATATEPS